MKEGRRIRRVLVANPAHAAQSAVLTTGSVGGADVAGGHIITSGLMRV